MTTPSQGADPRPYQYDSFSGTRPAGDNNFLWWCAGAHQPLLKRYPAEHVKYAGLGAVVLATFVLAALSAGYAIYSIFGSPLWTILFAIIWGLIIFNFDRFLVSTMRKYGVSRGRQFRMAVPRLVLALLIGITIARPLELKIFEKEISVKIAQQLHYKMQENDSLLQLEYKTQRQTALEEKDRLLHRKAALGDTLSRLQRDYLSEADGTGGSGRRGIESITRLKKEAYETYQAAATPELAGITTRVNRYDSLLNSASAAMAGQQSDYGQMIAAHTGFLEKNKALSDLAASEPSVWWTSLLLSLLIIFIEAGPVLSKLIMPAGPYDVALAKEELIQMAESENELVRHKSVTGSRQKLFFDKQEETTGELAEKMTALQRKYIDEELDKWERGEWQADQRRPSMDEVMRRMKERYRYSEDHLW